MVSKNRSIRISIIVPTFNRLELVRDLIEFFSLGIADDEELVLVDNCSDDGTREYLCNLRYDWLKWSTEARQGACFARNTGLSLCAGKYIKFLDSDDLIYFSMLRKQADYLDEHPNDLIVSSDVEIESFSGSILVATPPPRVVDKGFYDLIDVLEPTNPPTSSPLYRIHVLHEISGFNAELLISQDYDLVLRATFFSNHIVYLPGVVYRMRNLTKEGRVSAADSIVKQDDMCNIILSHVDLILKSDLSFSSRDLVYAFMHRGEKIAYRAMLDRNYYLARKLRLTYQHIFSAFGFQDFRTISYRVKLLFLFLLVRVIRNK